MASKKKAQKISGGEIISRMLAAEGVDKVFGIIDGTYFGMYSTFEKHGIDLITPRHESCAAHMAGAYAKVSNKLGVCMASNGPGVANVLPGVAVENAEGHRVLLITSCRRTPIVYPERGGTFQYFPQVDAIGAMCKWSCAVPSHDRVAELLRMALRHCYTGRPGLVHLDVPESIMNSPCELDPRWFREPHEYRTVEPLEPTASQIERAARLLVEAKSPLIQAGSGVTHAAAFEELDAVASQLQAAVTTSWAGRTAVDERKPYSVPMRQVQVVNKARCAADVVLVLGSRLGETDWWGKPPYWAPQEETKLIQVDIDPEVLCNIRPTELAVQADIKVFLCKLSEFLTKNRPAIDIKGRRDHLNELREAVNLEQQELATKLADESAPMHSSHVPDACQAVFDDDAIMVVDGGNTAVWANFYHEVRSFNTIVTTPKMGMLGAGVSQTLGAKVAAPDKQVYCIIGDGAMGFHMQEIETAVRNNLPVTWLVLCDKQWGMVKMNQQFALKPLKTFLLKSLPAEETINADLGEIAWDKLAQAMGAHGERVASPAELKPAIRRCIESGGPAVVHVDVDPVKHMWAPSLKDFKAMHEEPEG